jgi:hypothetical protein
MDSGPAPDGASRNDGGIQNLRFASVISPTSDNSRLMLALTSAKACAPKI